MQTGHDGLLALIVEKRFTAIAVEADLPDAWQVNRSGRGLAGEADADAALSEFQRLPDAIHDGAQVSAVSTLAGAFAAASGRGDGTS